MFGFLNVVKPIGWTSRDIVNVVNGIAKPEKSGHAGTLDPLASGVLLVAVGKARRLIRFAQEQRKVYRATFELGKTSNTDDNTGEITIVEASPRLTRSQIESLLPCFQGTIQQVPPQFSAVQVKGRRAYALARAGQNVELKSRSVTIDKLEIISFQDQTLELEIICGSGTYIRSIARDLGQQLGCGALMSALERTSIGKCHVDQAHHLEQLTPTTLGAALLPCKELLIGFPNYRLTPDEHMHVIHGRKIPVMPTRMSVDHADELILYDQTGSLVGIAEFLDDEMTLQPRSIFVDDKEMTA